MADTKLSALGAFVGANVITSTDVVYLVNTSSATSKKMLVDEFAIAVSTSLALPYAATQAQLEQATSTNIYVTPGRQQFHPAAAKAWVRFNGTSAAIAASYNVASVVRNSGGVYTITFTTVFSSANYATLATSSNDTAAYIMCVGVGGNAPTTSTVVIQNPLAANDATNINVACFGDQ